MSKVILAVVAHPDDESLAMGAVLARHAAEGDQIHVAVFSDGVTSRLPENAEAQMGRRLEHFQAACDWLGVDRRREMRIFEDQKSDRVAQLHINQAVEWLVRTVKPERVYTHFAGDLNLDHRRVSEAVQVATRGICEVWCCEPEWPTRWVGAKFDPHVRYVPPPQILERKLAACACYVDELRDPPHPRSLQEIRKRTEQGEAFEVIR